METSPIYQGNIMYQNSPLLNQTYTETVKSPWGSFIALSSRSNNESDDDRSCFKITMVYGPCLPILIFMMILVLIVDNEHVIYVVAINIFVIWVIYVISFFCVMNYQEKHNEENQGYQSI